MWPRFGIKVGNSTLCISHVKADGKVELIANKQGDRVSQACLLWEGGNEIACGLTAEQKLVSRPKQAVSNSFQLLLPVALLDDKKIVSALKEIPCDYDRRSHNFILKNIQSDGENFKESIKELSPYDVQVQLFRAELELARQYHDDEKQKPIVVLSIPNYYPEAAWNYLAEAADEAGFHVAQVISESTAALLAYGIGDIDIGNTAKYIVTIKSGGLFSQFALYSVRDGFYTLLNSTGPIPIGGRQYTEVLVLFICEEFRRKYKLDPMESRRSMAKIRTAVTNCKHILTTLTSTQLYIDSLMDGVDFNMSMSRARFESLIQPVISNFMQTLNDWIVEIQQQFDGVLRIDAIVVLGATMQIPKLQNAIASRFPYAQLHTSIATCEVVAVGCARQASFLINPQGQDFQITEKGAFAEEELSIWHGNNDMNATVIIRKGTLLPSKVNFDITRSETTENVEMFQLRFGEQIRPVFLKGAAPRKGNVFHMEAEINWKQQNTTIAALVRLRCI